MAKKKKKKVAYQYGGISNLQSPGSFSTPLPDDFYKIQNMPKVPALPVQDYGVKALNPQADLTAQLGQYPGKKEKDTTPWGDVATNALLLTNMLLPGDPIKNPVVRPQLGYSPQPQGRGSQAIAKHGAKVSNTGYKRNSKDKNQPNLRIPSNQITMDNVPHPILGISDTGDTQYMLPGGDYSFDGNYVDEFPIKAQNGAEVPLSNRSIAKKKTSPTYNPLTQPFGPTTVMGPKAPEQVEELIEIKDSKGLKSGKYPKKHIEGIVRASQEVGVDPAAAVALALQESNLGTAVTKGRRGVRQADLGQVNQFSEAQQSQLLEKSQRTGIGEDYLKLTMALKDKLDYAKRLGFTDEASQYQSYNGYGTITRDKFGGADKAYGVPIGEGIDMRKNPLYGKRVLGLKSDIAGNEEIDKIIKRPLSPQIMNYGGKTSYKNMYAEGGTLQPLTDDTFQINGPSHSKGGVDLMYGNQGVEVEGGETGYQADDGSLNIMGNMINPLTGRKFKDDSKIIAKKEQKIDKLLDYSVDLVNEADPKDKWGILKFNSGRVQMEGAFKKKGELSQSKEHLSTIQQAMLDYASENNIDPGAFSKGQFKEAKADNTAQNGKKLSLAQKHNNPGNLKFAKWMTKYGATKGDAGTDGGEFAKFPTVEAGQQAMVALLKDKNYQNRTVEGAISRWTNNQPYKNIPTDLKGKKIKDLDPNQFTTLLNTITQGEDSKTYNWNGVPDIPQTTKINQGIEEAMGVTQTPFNPREPLYAPKREAGRVKQVDYDTTLQPLTQYQKPSDARGLSLTQVLPELYAAATNQVEPVFMQEYTPNLYQDYEVSFQDRLNENQGTFSALTKAVGNDPSTLSTLAAQKYQADQQVLADEFRTNQAIEQDVVNKNISLLNDAKLKTLGLADTQFVRQSTAKSKTKQQNQLILSSIADKVHQNLYEQRLQKTYENLYPNYSFGEDYVTDYTGPTAGEAITWNPSFEPLPDNAQTTVRTDNKGNVSTTKKYPSTIQQSLQNLQLSTNKLKYRDYFLDRERKIAKDSRK